MDGAVALHCIDVNGDVSHRVFLLSLQDPIGAVNRVAKFVGGEELMTESHFETCNLYKHHAQEFEDPTLEEAKQLLYRFYKAPNEELYAFLREHGIDFTPFPSGSEEQDVGLGPGPPYIPLDHVLPITNSGSTIAGWILITAVVSFLAGVISQKPTIRRWLWDNDMPSHGKFVLTDG